MKILIVDDQIANVYLLEEFLADRYETMSAYNGLEALRIIAEKKVDLVLLDVMMPEMDGLEVLKHIKKQHKSKNISVIMVTARETKEDVKQALTAGADDYIKKPFDETELFTKINIQEKLIQKRNIIDEYQVYANIEESMILAQRIQQSLLPDKQSFAKIFPDSFIIYLPKDIVSGDFYFASEIKGKKFIGLYDCTGHGVPAAMLSMLAYMAINRLVIYDQITDPLEITNEIMKELIFHLSKSTDTYTANNGMEAAFCQYDASTREMEFVGAHLPLVIIRKNDNQLVVNGKQLSPFSTKDHNSLFIINGSAHSLNFEGEKLKFHKHHIQLLEGDTVYLFTDGFCDQMGGENEHRFTKKQFLYPLKKYFN